MFLYAIKIRYFDTKLYINELRQVNPFCGIKIYPSTGFYVFDKNLKETFEWAASQGVPVLSHCNYLGGIYNNVRSAVENNLNPQNYCDQDQVYAAPKYVEEKKFLSLLAGTNKSRNNKINCSYFLEPSTYKYVFNHFEKALSQQEGKSNPLKICLAHFGGDEQMNAHLYPKKADAIQKTPYGVTRTNWFTEIQSLMSQYKGAYTDISYAVFNKGLFSEFAKQDADPNYGSKILFGTDFFLTEQEDAQQLIYERFKAFARSHELPDASGNLWDKVASRNISTFLKSAYHP